MFKLSQANIVDGEGAKKFVTVNVIMLNPLKAKILLFQLLILLYSRRRLLEDLMGELLWG